MPSEDFGGRDGLIDAAEGAVEALSALEDYITDPIVRSLVRGVREHLEKAVVEATLEVSARRSTQPQS
jgi:hypothetical protein